MTCELITILTGSTSEGLCSGSGTSINVYADTSGTTLTNIHNSPGCLGDQVPGSFFFSYSGYLYTYVEGGIKDIDTCNDYCIINTGTYDGTYSITGTYDGYDYYTGLTGFIYYSIAESRWCLSSNLGDPCVQFGTYGNTSQYPDFDDTVGYQGICVTTTTTTNPCVDFDFTALFDCLITPTPSITPTSTVTPTPTPTPSPSDPCGGRDISLSISGVTPTQTPTPTPTPSPTPVITRPCNYSGEAIFNTFDEILQCSNSKKFKDCFTGIDYYTSDIVLVSCGTTPKQGYVY